MANINLPFVGEVTADNKEAFLISNKGDKGIGVKGIGTTAGVSGISDIDNGWGVYGGCQKPNGFGVVGQADGLNGVGVRGYSNAARSSGVSGINNADTGYGVYGGCQKPNGYGVVGQADGLNGVGVWAISWNAQSGTGVLAVGKPAGHFEGNVEVTGDITLQNADCAEDFEIIEENVEAGTVMVLNEMGSLQPSYEEYDKKVAGIVSGARGYKPAIVLDRQNSEDQNRKERMPIALMGKVYCKVDATCSPIEIGDLLTTSSTMGYAMKAEDPMKAFGAVIGKALGSIKEGLGMIPVLVTLQ
jgi:hypothetical protein